MWLGGLGGRASSPYTFLSVSRSCCDSVTGIYLCPVARARWARCRLASGLARLDLSWLSVLPFALRGPVWNLTGVLLSLNLRHRVIVGGVWRGSVGSFHLWV